jgi:protocatechuate 3,4-dioxygenase alpha subunit
MIVVTPANAKLVPTASQTVGPFFHIGLTDLERDPVIESADGRACVTVRVRIMDGDGAPVPDAVLEIWQADADGTYAIDGASGFGRVFTDDRGTLTFRTARPGAVPAGDGRLQAPHLVMLVFMRGLLRHLVTRMYFPGDPRNESDPVLAQVSPDRRATLVARAAGDAAGELDWDIVVQGDGETVFFEC